MSRRVGGAHRLLLQPSKVLAVSLPRPMGIILDEDTQRGRVVVSELVEGSEAAKRAKVQSLLRMLVPLRDVLARLHFASPWTGIPAKEICACPALKT